VPVVARLGGIRIILHYDDHNPPYVHVRCGEHRAVIDIAGGVTGGGNLPKSIERKALRWVKENKGRLLEMWTEAQAETTLVRMRED
jgi:hypothetical protein